MASELAIYYTPMHFMWGVKSGATPGHVSLMALLFDKGSEKPAPLITDQPF